MTTTSHIRAALERRDLRQAVIPGVIPPEEALERRSTSTHTEGAGMVVVTAYGLPAAQGSKKLVGGRMVKARMVDSNAATLRPWRETVAAAARQVRCDIGGCILGYVAIRACFTFDKPKSAHRGPKSKKPLQLPAGKDIDKLLRSVFDSLGRKVGAGLIEDDMKIIEVTAAKTYPGEHVDALDCPGVRIEIRRLAL